MFRVVKKPEILTLNVTALIDISAMLVIFLILGTFFGQSSIEVPNMVKLPKSINKDSIYSAPQISIEDDQVTMPFLKKKLPLAVFHEGSTQELKVLIKMYVDNMPAEAKQSDVLLNLVADQDTKYQVIFDVLRPFREAGFQSVMFVARGN